MPTTNKRINLTISDTIYERLQAYKLKNGITSDAAACMQLIIRQLDAIEQSEKMLQMMAHIPLEQLQAISNDGLTVWKEIASKHIPTE
jgi:hypothetical protein